MSSLRYALLVVASCALVSCKARRSEPPQETVTDLPSRLSAPVSKVEDYAVGDDVSLVDDDGRFEIDARVTAVTAAPKGYTVRIGSGRLASTKSLRPSQLFPAPWASAARVRVGDTIYERRFGNFTPSKCVVKEVPADVHGNISALCDGATRPQSVARRDTFYAFEPATLGALSTGDIVYYEKMHWVMVVGTSQPDGRVAIRATGFAKKDQLVSLSSIQRVR